MSLEQQHNQTLTAFSNSTRSSLNERNIVNLVFLSIIFSVGILGNLLVCYVTSRKRGQTSTGNLFILHLAIGDLGILFVNFPLVIVRHEIHYPWPFGGFICKAVYPFAEIFFGVEIGCITAIAFHRYRMLVHCTKPQITLANAKKIVFIIWFISFIFIVAPLLFVMDLQRQDCRPNWPNKLSEQLFSISNSLMFYVIPLAIIIITYIKIRGVLSANSSRNDSYQLYRRSNTRSNMVRSSQNRRAIQILTPVVIIFAITMLPITVLRIVSVFQTQVMHRFEYSWLFFDISCAMLIANSSVNPIIYSVTNSEFRRDFINCLNCKVDKCCMDTSESLNTLRRSSEFPRNIGCRRSSAPLVKQSGLSPRGKNFGNRRRQSLDSALKDPMLQQPTGGEEFKSDKPPSVHPKKTTLLIKVNPTYETGGF